MKYSLVIEFESVNKSIEYIFKVLKPLLKGTLHELEATNISIISTRKEKTGA